MKKAFVHDRIFHLGWAETVFFDILKKNSSEGKDTCKIFTLFSDRKSINSNNTEIEIITALPQKLNQLFVNGSKNKSKIRDYRNLIVFYPLLTRLLRRKITSRKPDQTYISSFAAVKNIQQWSSQDLGETILYLHSPNQYIRENKTEYMKKFNRWQKGIFSIITPFLQYRDKQKRTYSKVVANSHYTKECAQTYYWLKAKVNYPKIEKTFLSKEPTENIKNYFVYMGRLTTFVREVHILIQLSNTLTFPLIIMGSGPDELLLKQLAWPQISFIGHITDQEEKAKIVSASRWLLNIAKESCWISTMEALALWVPVLAYNQGGSKELINEDNWYFIKNKKPQEIVEAFNIFSQEKFNRQSIKDNFIKYYTASSQKTIVY